MAKHIFVSCNFKDREVSRSVKELIEQQNLEGQIVFVEDVSHNGETAVDWEIEHTLERCDAALFVIGDNVRNSPWIEREAAHVLAKDIPVVAARLPGMELKCPSQLADKTMLTFDAGVIAENLNRC